MIWPIFFILFISQLFKCEENLEGKKQINVKIIQEPAQNQFAQSHFEALYGDRRRSIDDFNNDASDLKPKFKPANFSGPLQLEQLNGICFEHLNNDYRWVVCPFHNVTQFEQNLRLNPYKGILGVWYEWEIVDNKFVSMVMLNGDDCGSSGSRQTKVYFNCNPRLNKTQIEEVSEPQTCQYKIVLSTPLVCEQTQEDSLTNSMSVYPFLSENLRSTWDQAYSEFSNGLITDKTYNLTLRIIFEKAGFYRSEFDQELLKILTEEKQNDDLVPVQDFLRSASTSVKYRESASNIEEELRQCKMENRRLQDLLELSSSNQIFTTTFFS